MGFKNTYKKWKQKDNLSREMSVNIGMEYTIALSQKRIDKHLTFRKFGYRDDITTASLASPVLIWNYADATEYTYSTTNDITSISSSSTSDTQDIVVQGLDVDYNLITQTVTLTGQTTATLSTPLLRVFRAYNTGSALNGDVYIYVGATQTAGVPDTATDVRAFIGQYEGQTQMCLFTIPKGYFGFIHATKNSIGFTGSITSSGEQARYVIRTRLNGQSFLVKENLDLTTSGTSAKDEPIEMTDLIPSGTDIEMNLVRVSDTLNASSTIGFELIPEEEYTPAFRTAMGQI